MRLIGRITVAARTLESLRRLLDSIGPLYASVLTILILAAIIALSVSFWTCASWTVPLSNGTVKALFADGHIELRWHWDSQGRGPESYVASQDLRRREYVLFRIESWRETVRHSGWKVGSWWIRDVDPANPPNDARLVTPIHRHAGTVDVRLWLLVTVSLVGLGLWCLTQVARMRYRIARGRCIRCRYDLTGNSSGVCPECGTTIPEVSQAS